MQRAGLVLAIAACGTQTEVDGDGDGSTTLPATTKADVPPSAASTGGPYSTSTIGDPSGTSGGPACVKTVVLMGYWPPTNEMLRRFSDNPLQNPGPWMGANWEGHGYDVHAFFPEFPPDGDPTNDDIGDPGAVGDPAFDLQVDYQATSADFWRIVDEYAPSIVITTSRGGDIGWELEAVEGGHGTGNPRDAAFDWSSDQNPPVTHPTQESIEPRSWDAISTFRMGNTLASQLPLDAILDATSSLRIASVEIDNGTSGDFLSGFLGLHGVYYASITDHAVAGGHIHVGFGLPTATAQSLLETTLRTVVTEHPADSVPCPQ